MPLTFDRVTSSGWSRTLSRDPLAGTETIFHWSPEGRIIIQKRQRVDPILEMNRAQRVLTDRHTPWGNQLARTVASLPVSTYWDLKQRGIIDDPKRFKAWINDSANEAFRTRVGLI